MKIMEKEIKIAACSECECYEVQEESSECEYSEEWFSDAKDPIKDYVNNALEDSVNDIENYEWDLDTGICIYFTKHVNDTNIEHILYYKKKPIALYYVCY